MLEIGVPVVASQRFEENASPADVSSHSIP